MQDTPSFQDKNYTKHANQIKLVRDLYSGTDEAIKHLRQFPKEENNIYSERQADSALDSFVFSTVDTIKNIIFRKKIDLSGITNKEVLKWTKKVDFNNSINSFAKQLLVNYILDRKTYLLVDRAEFNEDTTPNGATQSDFSKRPYFVNVLRENVLNREYDEFNQLTRVSIRETYTERTGSFSTETKEQIKVWYSDGKIETWREEKIVSTIQTNLKQIPLIEIGIDDVPITYNQAKMNVQHFNRNSECANYVRVGASPFLAVFGQLEKGDKPVTLGINSGLKFNDKTQSDVKWIEMTGQNYKIINEEITKLEDQMLRVAVAFVSQSQNKTATQVQKESTEGEAKLNTFATDIEEGINQGLALMDLFTDANLGENIISVNKDFDSSILTPEQAGSYRNDYMQGIISLERLWQLYEKGEYIPITSDEEKVTEKTLLKDNEV